MTLRPVLFASLVALAATFISVPASAQENYNAKAKDAPFVLHPDRTATLKLKAPKGHKVTAFATFAPGIWVDMEYSDSLGAYVYTTPEAVSPYHHTYFFVYDGVQITDPANVHTVRDVTWQRNFVLPKGDGDDQATLMSTNHTPHGSVASVWYDSKVAGRARRMNVYLPPSYFTSSDKRYPVLYMLHGMGGDENAWLEMGRLPQVLDNLIARGRAEEMIVVMPNGVIDVDAAPGYGEAGLVQPEAEFPHLFTGQFDLAFPEIVEFTDSAFRTIADYDHRAIAGLSMGGYNSANISRQYPDMFGYVGLFSAATKESISTNPDLRHLLTADDLRGELFSDFDGKLRRQFERNPRLYWIAIGTDDFLYDANKDYRAKLDAEGYPYIYRETPGGHSWNNWREYSVEFLPLLFK